MILNIANSMHLDETDLELFRKAKVLMDTSGRSLTDLGSLLKREEAERFAFGTHSLILDYLTGMLRIEALRENEADENTKELLRSGNTKVLLQL